MLLAGLQYSECLSCSTGFSCLAPQSSALTATPMALNGDLNLTYKQEDRGKISLCSTHQRHSAKRQINLMKSIRASAFSCKAQIFKETFKGRLLCETICWNEKRPLGILFQWSKCISTAVRYFQYAKQIQNVSKGLLFELEELQSQNMPSTSNVCKKVAPPTSSNIMHQPFVVMVTIINADQEYA